MTDPLNPRFRPGHRQAGDSPVVAPLGQFLHLPVGLKPGAALVVTLHGCTQTAEGYARDAGWVELSDQEGFAVLAPEQTRSGNANLCFNWFLAEQAGPQGREVLAILAMIDQIVATHRLDRDRVFVTGLSAGGAMAFALLMAHPQVFAGGGVLAGLPFRMAEGVAEALVLMRSAGAGRAQLPERSPLHPTEPPKLSIWQGQDDRTVAPGNADQIARQWKAVAGLPALPDSQHTVGTRQTQVWTDPSGNPVLEIHRLAGLGHATPIATGGPGGLGRAAPHVVECGHSSTRLLAESWGLATSSPAHRQDPFTTDDLAIANDDPGRSAHRAGGEPPKGLRADIVEGLPSAVPENIRALIDRSLRQAGL